MPVRRHAVDHRATPTDGNLAHPSPIVHETAGTVPRMHDDETDIDDEFAQLIGDEELTEDEVELSEHDANAHTLSIRRADGTEVVTVSTLGSGQPWAVFMAPGGRVQNAYVGGVDSPLVWLNSDDHAVSRDEDGTYVITID